MNRDSAGIRGRGAEVVAPYDAPSITGRRAGTCAPPCVSGGPRVAALHLRCGFAEDRQKKPRRVCEANQFKSVFPATCAASSDRARSAQAAEASSPAAHPLPRSSSPNQSICFDLVRSGSGMSLLSRLRGSKGYGTCRDAARPSLRPNRAKPGAIKASIKKNPAVAGFFFGFTRAR
jgi:hypothetical protein